MQSSKQRVNTLITIWRMIKLTCHFLVGFFRLSLFGKYYTDSDKERLVQRWSSKLLKLLDIRVVIEGSPPQKFDNMLLVANHVSWLDILIIFTVIKPRFVAKKEIAKWPFVGSLVKLGDTIFIERDNKRSIRSVNLQMSHALQQGGCIAVFPEGRTSLGISVGPFKSSLFDSIIRSNGGVLPIALQYLDSSLSITTRPSFAQVTLFQSIWNILSCHKLTVKISLEQILQADQFLDRSSLASASRQEILKHWP